MGWAPPGGREVIRGATVWQVPGKVHAMPLAELRSLACSSCFVAENSYAYRTPPSGTSPLLIHPSFLPPPGAPAPAPLSPAALPSAPPPAHLVYEALGPELLGLIPMRRVHVQCLDGHEHWGACTWGGTCNTVGGGNRGRRVGMRSCETAVRPDPFSAPQSEPHLEAACACPAPPPPALPPPPLP